MREVSYLFVLAGCLAIGGCSGDQGSSAQQGVAGQGAEAGAAGSSQADESGVNNAGSGAAEASEGGQSDQAGSDGGGTAVNGGSGQAGSPSSAGSAGTEESGCGLAGSLRTCDEGGLLGACAAGTQICQTDGSWSACSIEPGAADTCEDGNDANCNGVPNEGCPCVEGQEQTCGDTVNVGICQLGLSRCDAEGKWGECEGAVYPRTELCDERWQDEDCDGQTNEAPACVGVVQVASGTEYTCALLDNGSVKCWGRNDQGQLGLGDTDNRGDDPGEIGDDLPAVDLGTGRTAVAISVGADHTCVLLDDESVKCWGQNFAGQLGLGDTDSRGDDANEMGDNLPVVDLGTDRTAVAISAGTTHACALLDDGRVKCWGYNNKGELGLGELGNRGSGANEMGDNLPVVDLGTGRTAVAISTGDVFTCALLDDESVKCWGGNSAGQLGLGDTEDRGDEPGEMGDNLPTIDLGTGRTAVTISPAYYHTCALLDDGSVKCWGTNALGNLGLGDTERRGDDANEMGDNLPVVDVGAGRTTIAISAHYFHTCALLDNGSVKCWGSNSAGQLGLGDTEDRGDDPGEMGDNLPVVVLGSP